MSDKMKRPNILLIVADDLGYSDLGCYGGEIRTPNIDRLGMEGLRFSDFHSAAMCSPTRSMILSGTDCHLAGVGVMFEVRNSDPIRFNKPGHEGFLNHDVAALPELLQDGGYHTLMSGKWHLGFKEENIPARRGFDRSWSLLPACANHYGWEPYFERGEFDRPRVPGLLPMLYTNETERWMPKANTSNDPKDGYYSSTYCVSNLLEYLKDHKSSNSDKPFFAYLPFSAPHWPLQCPPEDRDRYQGKYDIGPDELRLRRLKGLKEKGLVAENVKAHDVMARSKEWNEMTEEEQKMSCRAMEVFAGMVDRVDQEVGRVLDYLDETKQMDNTIIIFMSDNGAEGSSYEAAPVMGPKLMDTLDRFFNNSYENIGNHNSFVWYGPRWAQASTAPHRLYKGFSTEGGIRVPFIIRYPGLQTRYPAGSVVPSFTTCMDIMPTLLSLAGVEHPNTQPATSRNKVSYRGHQVYTMRGRNWVPYLTDKTASKTTKSSNEGTAGSDEVYGIYDEKAVVGWELHGKSSLRKGKWKIVNIPYSQFAKGTWELYNLDADRGEIEDLSDKYPEVMQDMLEEWANWVEETGTIGELPWKAPGGGPHKMPDDMIGGDPTEDMRAWMRVGHGQKIGEEKEKRPDVEAWKGFNE